MNKLIFTLGIVILVSIFDDANTMNMDDMRNAIYFDKLQEVERLTREHPQHVNDLDTNPYTINYTPLLHASLHGNLATVLILLNAGADPNGGSGPYPLDSAPTLEITKALINAGADVLQGNPLYKQARDGNLPQVIFLLCCGANPNGDGLNRPIDVAASYEIAKTLINAGADILQGNPLLQPSKCGDLFTLELLLELGANPNASNDGWTPLHNAAFYGYTNIAIALLVKGADTSAKIPDESSLTFGGKTPKEVAIMRGHNDTAALL